MTFTKWKIKDNAETQLQTSITSTATTIVLASGGGAKMPDVPCILTLNARSGQEVIKLEKVKVTEKINDNLKVDRGYGGTTAQSFDAGDYVSCFVTVEPIQDLQDEVTRLETSKKDDFDFADIPLSSLKDGPSETPANNEYLKWNETNERYEPSELSIVTNRLTDYNIINGEQVQDGDFLFAENGPTFYEATLAQNICDVAGNKRVSGKQVGSGVAGNTLKLSLAKASSPSVNLNIRLETDNNGSPSGTLVDANATATIAPASLTTSLACTTLTLGGAVTIAKGTPYHIVAFAGTYGSETVNGTNYYKIGYSSNDTTTRGSKLWNGTAWGAVRTAYNFYVSTTLSENILLSKTDANFLYKTKIYGIANTNGIIGDSQEVILLTSGIILLKYNGMQKGLAQYLGTDGKLSSIKGTNIVQVGFALTDNKLRIDTIGIIAGTKYTLFTSNTEKSLSVTSYTPIKSAKIIKGGTYTITFEMKPYSSSGFYCRIYLNGVGVGTERFHQAMSYTTFTENINCNSGDIIQLCVKNGPDRYGYVRLFKGEYDILDPKNIYSSVVSE